MIVKQGTRHKKEVKEKIGESMMGNSNAEKWTLEETIAMLDKIGLEAQDKDCLWLGSALVRVGLYKQIWSEWKDKFENEKTISESIKKIEQIFEDRIVTRGLKGDANATMTIFTLKNNYDWKDKTEQDVNLKGRVAFSDMTDEQIDDGLERIKEREAKFNS